MVYMAEQTEPVRRKVALKVIKPGMDTPPGHRPLRGGAAGPGADGPPEHRPRARRRGTTESGRPYFVMELVHGVPITEYCDENHLTPRQRLELFVPVCQAIQHAHQKGIIHRDIKPSNVLVTLYDGKPVPKVIDFGVAKAIEQQLTERTLFTQFGTMVGTPEYMSPEQAEMSGLDIDTRSDIYSLGVLLYELLTGTTPFEQQAAARGGATTRCCGMIREEEPPKPSTRLSDSRRGAARPSRPQRHTEPAKLAKLVRGELDWIVMKALEKDRNRRYETANGLRDGRAALPGRRAGAGVPAVGRVSVAEVRPAEQGAGAGGSAGAAGSGRRHRRHDLRTDRSPPGARRGGGSSGQAIQAQQRETQRTGERLAKQAALGAAEAERNAKEAEPSSG